MRGKLLILLSMLCLAANGQSLVKKFTWKSNTISGAKVEWADINNDSLLDVMVLAKGANQKLQVTSYQNSLTAFALANNQELNLAINSYSFADVNSDNKLDVVINGFLGTQQSKLLINESNFQFAESSLSVSPLMITCQTWADLNQDGKLDWVVGGNDFLKIFQATPTGYLLKLDSTGLKVTSLATSDFDKDGKVDLIVSGSKSNKPFLSFLKWKNGFTSKVIGIKRPLSGTMAIGDFNHDGNFDVVVNGMNASSRNLINYYTFKSGNFTVIDSLVDYQSGQLLLADVNSDGFSELSYLGRKADGKKANILIDTLKSITQLDTTQVTTQRWGDYDRDGDLDLLQARDSAGYQVFQIFEIQTLSSNKSPQRNGITFSATAFNKSIIYWDPAKDDHTPAKTLSYDLLLTKSDDQSIRVSSLFDIVSTKRITPSNGNQSINNFAIIPNLNELFKYLVQPIDNAFNGAYKTKCYGGVCGKGGSCPSADVNYTQACKGTNTALTSAEPAYWFSFAKGYQGLSSSLEFIASEPDTVISVIYKGADCPLVKAHVIQINAQLVSETQTKYTCADESLKVGIKPGWQTVLWTYESNTSTADSITLIVKKPMLVNVVASTGTCTYKKEFNIKLSIVELKLENDHYVIGQGESVQLAASGAKRYLWLPPSGLSNNQSASPVASPIRSTVYELTAYDSIGCFKKGTVKIDVVATAFIPNLFTPNGDGKNDELKILGINGATDFDFSIYNRDGNMVYETTNWQTAASVGWDGQKSGTKQPSGLYYWKIVGQEPNGQQLLLNGKSTGSVLLVR
jgi:gliding motility-associated-like protein